jgi:hypothetical protein
MRVEELVPRLEAIGQDDDIDDEPEDAESDALF